MRDPNHARPDRSACKRLASSDPGAHAEVVQSVVEHCPVGAVVRIVDSVSRQEQGVARAHIPQLDVMAQIDTSAQRVANLENVRAERVVRDHPASRLPQQLILGRLIQREPAAGPIRVVVANQTVPVMNEGNQRTLEEVLVRAADAGVIGQADPTAEPMQVWRSHRDLQALALGHARVLPGVDRLEVSLRLSRHLTAGLAGEPQVVEIALRNPAGAHRIDIEVHERQVTDINPGKSAAKSVAGSKATEFHFPTFTGTLIVPVSLVATRLPGRPAPPKR